MKIEPAIFTLDKVRKDYLRLVGVDLEGIELIYEGRQNTVFKVSDRSETSKIVRYRTAKEFWYEDCIKEPLIRKFTDVDIPDIIAFDEVQRPQVLISEFVEGVLLSDVVVDRASAVPIGQALTRIHVNACKSTNFLDFVNGRDSSISWVQRFSISLIETAIDCGFRQVDVENLLNKCNKPLLRAEERLVLVHNDFHFKNLIRRANGGICVLDWDSASIAPAEKDFVKLLDWSHGNTGIVSDIIDSYEESIETELDLELLELFRIFSDLRQISFQSRVAGLGESAEVIEQGGYFDSNVETSKKLIAAFQRLDVEPWVSKGN